MCYFIHPNKKYWFICRFSNESEKYNKFQTKSVFMNEKLKIQQTKKKLETSLVKTIMKAKFYKPNCWDKGTTQSSHNCLLICLIFSK